MNTESLKEIQSTEAQIAATAVLELADVCRRWMLAHDIAPTADGVANLTALIIERERETSVTHFT